MEGATAVSNGGRYYITQPPYEMVLWALQYPTAISFRNIKLVLQYTL
jgi:hypothetical protein